LAGFDDAGNLKSGTLRTTTWADTSKADSEKRSYSETVFSGGHPSLSTTEKYDTTGTLSEYSETDFSLAGFDDAGNLKSGTLRTTTWADPSKAAVKKRSYSETVFSGGHPSLSTTEKYDSTGILSEYSETDFSMAGSMTPGI